MTTYTTEAASVPFFAVQPQRTRAPTHQRPQSSPHPPQFMAPPLPPMQGPAGGHVNGPQAGSRSPFAYPGMAVPSDEFFQRAHHGGACAGPQHMMPQAGMEMQFVDPYGPYTTPAGSYGHGCGQPFPSARRVDMRPPSMYPNVPAPPPPPSSLTAPSHTAPGAFLNTSSSWIQDQTPIKTHSMSHFYEEYSSMLSGATPAGLTASRMKESRLGASRLGASAMSGGGGNSPSLLLSPQQGFSGLALEKNLLQAHKDELVQILLELASCDVAASSFIHTKARFFAFRRDVGQDRPDREDGSCVDGGGGGLMAGTADNSSVMNRSDERGAKRDTPRSHERNAKDQSRTMSQLHDTEDVASAIDSLSHQDSAIHGDTSRLLFSAADSPAAMEAAKTPSSTDRAGSASNTSVPHGPSLRPSPLNRHRSGRTPDHAPPPPTRAAPEARSFSADFHPCLRWYGTCRNTTSCVYVALPQNVCLNWIRGACAAGTECSGVHHLPESCPPEVQRIFDLSHGVVDRRVAGGALAQPRPQGFLAPAAAPPCAVGWQSSVHSSAARPMTRSPDAASSRGPHTPRHHVVSHSADKPPSALLVEISHRTAETELGGAGPQDTVVTASPSRAASCSDDTLDALLEQGLRPALQTASYLHRTQSDHSEDGDEEGTGRAVFRCLNDSFARAAEETSNTSNGSA